MFNKTDNLLKNLNEAIKCENNRCVISLSGGKINCDSCVKKCPVSAITVINNKVSIDFDKCLDCGICIKECRTGVFSSKYFSDVKFYNKIFEYVRKFNFVVLNCRNVASASGISIPCIGWLDLAAFTFALANNTQKIFIRHSNCSSCKIGCGMNSLNVEIEKFNKLQERVSKKCDIILNADCMEYSNVEKKLKSDKMMSRRGLFSFFKKQAVSSLRDVISYTDSYSASLINNKNSSDEDKKIPLRRKVLIQSLDTLTGGNALTTFPEHFNSVFVDTEKCDLCGVCYRFCPTAALSELSEKNNDNVLIKVGVQTEIVKCVGCNVCFSLCDKHALVRVIPPKKASIYK